MYREYEIVDWRNMLCIRVCLFIMPKKNKRRKQISNNINKNK